jgi:hypothetical protein
MYSPDSEDVNKRLGSPSQEWGKLGIAARNDGGHLAVSREDMARIVRDLLGIEELGGRQTSALSLAGAILSSTNEFHS